MTTTVLISLSCPDRVGLVASVAGYLFEAGGNIGDATFAVLGSAADLTAVVDFPDDVELGAVEAALRELPLLEGAEITVSPFELAPVHGPTARVTHRITVSGGDRPGLVARLCEAFAEFDANIVRLDSEKIPTPTGDQYAVRIALHVPADKAKSCLATVSNTAGSLGLRCDWQSA